MRQNEILTIMRSAWEWSRLSKGQRLKVGAIIRTNTGILIPGYNGDPIGGSNILETTDGKGNLVTKLSVIHAEENCILKAAKQGVAVDGSKLFVTHAPCEHCAAQIINSGIREVYYTVLYRSDDGVKLLDKHGVFVSLVKYEDMYEG